MRKLLIWLMIFVTPVSMVWAETSAAMLYSNGNFSLNGVTGPRSSAIMSGDRVETGDSGAVSITRTGSNVLVGPKSSVVYEDSAIRVAEGSAFVSTSKSLAAQVEGVSITPAQPQSTYRVTRSGKEIRIAAVKGSLVLTEGALTRTVAEGSTAVMAEPNPQRPGAIPGAAQITSGINTKVALAIAGAALLATTIIVLTQVDKECSAEGVPTVSPVCPD